MNSHVPGFADFLRLAFWLLLGSLTLRAVLGWLLRTREILRRQTELEGLLRAIGAHHGITLPEPVVHRSPFTHLKAWFARLRA